MILNNKLCTSAITNQKGKLEESAAPDPGLPAEDVHEVAGDCNREVAARRRVLPGVGDLQSLLSVILNTDRIIH